MDGTSVEVTAQWALRAKEPHDAGYRILAASDGTLGREHFETLFDRYSPGPLEDLPQVTTCWARAAEHRFAAIVLHDRPDDDAVDAGGRSFIRSSLFVMRYEELTAQSVSYRAMYERFRSIRLPLHDRRPIQVTFAPQPPAPPPDPLAVEVAAWLLTGRPVCIVGADQTTVAERLQFLENVASLLPYGMRSELSASTWASSTYRAHKIRLFFAAADRGTGDFIATWGAPLDRPGVGSKRPSHSPRPTPGGHVFISYAREDAPFVDALEARLAAEGIPVWRDISRLWPGDDWRVKIRQAITADALAFIACFSKRSLSKNARYQNEELALAVEQLRLRRPDLPWLIPVRFDDCDIPDRDIGGRLLSSIQRADLFGASTNAEADRLVEAVLHILGQPHDPPAASVSSAPSRLHRLDLDTFKAVSAGAAATSLAEMPAEDAVQLLAKAPPSIAADALEVLLSIDQPLAVALLGRMNRRTAERLAKVISAQSELAWVEQVPVAAQAIERCEIRMRNVLGSRRSGLTSATSERGTQGYFQAYDRGQIHWTAQHDVQVTQDAIAEYHIALGGDHGTLGFPVHALEALTAGAWCQLFESDGRLAMVYSSTSGTYAVSGAICLHYMRQDGHGSSLGFPTSDAYEVGPSRRHRGQGTVGLCQGFAGGSIYSYNDKAFIVPKPIADYHDDRGGVKGGFGFPVNDYHAAASSPYGTSGHLQSFGMAGAAIYVSEPHGVHGVSGGIGKFHENQGGTGGWLGFPISEVTDARIWRKEPYCCYQHFEGGTIFWKEPYKSIAVPRRSVELLWQDEELRHQLGFPTAPETGLAENESQRIQFFENGVVTVRDEVAEVWLRPARAEQEEVSRGG